MTKKQRAKERKEYLIAYAMRRAFHGHNPWPSLLKAEYCNEWFRLAKWYLRRHPRA